MDVKKILVDAISLLVVHRGRFINALAIPFVLLVGLDLLQLVDVPTFVSLVTSILGLLVYAVLRS